MRRSIACIIGLMAVVGWPSLAMPFRGDEALFAVVAQDLAAGSVLYRDHWDITNPGIFWFYQLAGTLCGFSETGIRLFEWLWITAFVLAVAEAARRAAGMDRLPLAPALFVGAAYYAAGYSATSTLTKTEGLVSFPLFLAVWFASRACEGGRGRLPWLVAAGAAGGIVVLFKMLLSGCLALPWLYLLWVYVSRAPSKGRAIVEFAGGLACGLLLVLAPAVGYFAFHGETSLLVRTLFELPPKIMAEAGPSGTTRLVLAIKWFLQQYAPVLAAAAFALGCRLRSPRDPMVVALLLALATATAAVLIQRLSWWTYHFLLPGSLVGVIASYGWPAACQAVRARLTSPLTTGEKAVLAAAAGVLLFESFGAEIYQDLRLLRFDMGLTAKGRRDFRDTTGTTYDEVHAETNWLADPAALPGPIYVCGDPLFYWLSGRRPAVAISGWSLELYPREVRAELAEQLERALPVYVYVSRNPYHYDDMLRDRYPEVLRILAADYKPVRTSADGTWYERTKPPAERGS